MLRVENLSSNKGEEAAVYVDIMKTYINDSTDRLMIAGKNAINSMSEGDENRMLHMGLKRFTKTSPFNSKDARRRIAARLIEANKYCF
jgi:hypothetical protein